MAFVALMLAGAAVAGCPDKIHDNQLVAPVAGWSVHVDADPRFLDRVKVFSGPPSLKRQLKPMPGPERSQKWIAKGEDLWVECRYHDTSAVLTRNLGSQASCTLRRASQGGGMGAVMGGGKGDGGGEKVSFAKFECE